MNSNSKIYLQIVLISSFLILVKYLVSYFYVFNEDLLLKILRLEDVEYLFIVESLSRMDFKTDWSIIYKAENIIGFPIFSIIWHSIFFIFFKYYSIIILGVIFLFILYLLIFKILRNLNFDKKKSFFILISLVTIIQVLKYFGYIYEINLFYVVQQPLFEFVGSRFPRPLITSIYLFLSIFCLQKISCKKNLEETKKYLFLLCLSLALLINSFFYLFLVVSILSFLILLFNFRYNVISFIKKNTYSFIQLLSIIIIGFLVIVVQNSFSESDYSYRIGLYNINFEKKLYLINYFFLKLFQPEIIILLFLSIIFKFFIFKKFTALNNNYNVLFYFFISSILAPFIFILLSNKMISLYHFWTIVKFSGFLFVYLSIFVLFFNKFNKINLGIYNFSLIIVLLIFNVLNAINLEKNINHEKIYDLSKLRGYLVKNNFLNSNINLYTNDYEVKHIWLDLDNKYLTTIDGFSSSQSNDQLEETVLNILKLFNIQNDKLIKMLSDIEKDGSKRNNFSAEYFNYRYSVNTLRHYKPLVNEYTKNEIKIIKGISPLVSYYTIIPKSEKLRILDKYKKINISKLIYPDMIILKKNDLFKTDLIIGEYKKIYFNKTYTILKKKIL